MGRELAALTDLQRSWAEHYVGPAKFNATEAARMAGLNPDYGRSFRAKAHVMAYVAELQAQQLDDWRVSQQRTIAEIAAIAYSDITDLVTITDEGAVLVRSLDGLPKAVTAAIKKIKLRRTATRRSSTNGDDDEATFDEILELEFHDKLEALRLLGQWQGIFRDGGGEPAEPWTGIGIVPPDGPAPDASPSDSSERE